MKKWHKEYLKLLKKATNVIKWIKFKQFGKRGCQRPL